MKIKTTPTGDTYITYENFDYLSNGELVDINVNNIIFFKKWYDSLPEVPDFSGYYTKEETDNLLENYYNISEIDSLLDDYYTTEVIDEKFDSYYTKEVIDEKFDSYYTKTESDDLLADKVDLEIYIDQTDELQSAVSSNTSSINTLNNIVTANFETYGRYQIVGQSLSDTDLETRFNISEQIPLDSSYITVSDEPNQFVNLKDGKITFNIIADGITNDDVNNLTIELKIYKNDILLDSESKIIEAGKTVSVNFAGTFDVLMNDVVYATLEIISGSGTLTSNNPVVIGIDFKSTNSQDAIKSSQVVNDYTDLPNNGINPLLNQIDSNSSDITSILNSIDSINQKIDKINTIDDLYSDNTGNNTKITLNNSLENYKLIEVRMYLSYSGYNDKDIIFNILSEKIVYNRDIIALVTGGGDKAEFTFTNATTITLKDANNKTWIRGVYGKEAV